MIEVTQLTRSFGARPAIADLSFTVRRGQVLGLLGPAGAGKSTTLRVLTGALRPSSGRATIAGLDPMSRAARRRIGYLPQSRPLPGELRVTSLLQLQCRLHGLPPSLARTQVDVVVATCDLEAQRGTVIERLSEEVRERVALALAAVHDPDVLVLDEPVAATRGLVAELARQRAVLVTGASELQAACDRVLVLREGRVAAEGAPAEVVQGPRSGRGREVTVVVRGDAAAVERAARALDGVADVGSEPAGDGDRRLVVTGNRDDLQDALARLVLESGAGLRELHSRELDQEEAP